MVPPPASQRASEVKLVVFVMALVLAVYTFGSPLYWKLVGNSTMACSPCHCDCSADSLLPGSDNSQADCERMDPFLKEDLDKSALDLLNEELKLHEAVSGEAQRHSDSALLDAKKLASQYQKEAEKCNAGMETCEEAREKSQAALQAQKAISAMWEKRARELGWRDRKERQSIFSRIISRRKLKL